MTHRPSIVTLRRRCRLHHARSLDSEEERRREQERRRREEEDDQWAYDRLLDLWDEEDSYYYD